MKLNRSVLVAAMVIGSTVAVAGCNGSDEQGEAAEQQSSAVQNGSTEGTTQLASVATDARWGRGWGWGRGRGREVARERGREVARERRWEHRREERREHERPWWRRWWWR